jgi:hypothetical protein
MARIFGRGIKAAIFSKKSSLYIMYRQAGKKYGK